METVHLIRRTLSGTMQGGPVWVCKMEETLQEGHLGHFKLLFTPNMEKMRLKNWKETVTGHFFSQTRGRSYAGMANVAKTIVLMGSSRGRCPLLLQVNQEMATGTGPLWTLEFVSS